MSPERAPQGVSAPAPTLATRPTLATFPQVSRTVVPDYVAGRNLPCLACNYRRKGTITMGILSRVNDPFNAMGDSRKPDGDGRPPFAAKRDTDRRKSSWLTVRKADHPGTQECK